MIPTKWLAYLDYYERIFNTTNEITKYFTNQTLVDKTKELEETVATQTSTIERLTTKLDLANKDNASDNDTKQNDITNATTWLANKRKFNNPTDNDVVDIK